MEGNIYHYKWIDICKGIGIIIVVIGHCIFPCHQLIDVFHMPLFFFISGLTWKSKNSREFIVGKINRIGIPFVFWSILSAILALIPHPYSGPFNGPLWFLQCIFSALIIAQLSNRLSQLYKILIIAIIMLLLYLTISKKLIDNFLPFSLLRALTAYIYIYIGYVCRNVLLKISPMRDMFALASYSIIFTILFIYLYKFCSLNGYFFDLSIYEKSIMGVFLCSFAGILLSCYLAKIINSNSLLEYIGRNSLAIMLVHFPFAQIFNVYISRMPIYQNTVWRSLMAVTEWVIIIAISMLIVLLIKKFIPQVSGYKSMIKL